MINVKTPYGPSKDYKLIKRTMQGDTWACALASAQVDSFGKEIIVEEHTFMYHYMGLVPCPLLGQVDDLIGVAEAGHKTKQLNAFVNVKTADKDLQFGPDKCKSMIVSKKQVASFQNPELKVDAWKLTHEPNGNMTEEYVGKVGMENVDSFLYLGHVLSQDGGNMKNILHKRNRSLGTQKLIPKLIKHLGPFTFEAAIIYIKALLRTSILYGAETMFNVTEKELRVLESIEESVLQTVFQTKRSCSRHLLYLESGLIPARYQVHHQMINFLQYILLQPSESLINRVFMAQKQNPSRGDWVGKVTQLLAEYSINMTLLEIRNMKPSLFKSMVKRSVHEKAFKCLIMKQNNGQKGSFIEYEKLELASYLLSKSNISVTNKLEMFAIRCEMNDLPSNYGKTTNCEIGCPNQIMNNEHLINCPKLNCSSIKYNITEILNGTNKQKIRILTKFNENNKRRTEYLRD